MVQIYQPQLDVYMTKTRTFSPPRFPGEGEIQPLTNEELGQVWSGSGAKRTGAGGHYESNSTLLNWRSRGLYPDPGIFNSMAMSDPIVASGLYKCETYVSALNWRISPPPDPTDLELERTRSVGDMLDSMEGGLTAFIKHVLRQMQFGFSLFEKVYQLEPSHSQNSSLMRLEHLIWLHPSTVRKWIFNETGRVEGIQQKSERGTLFIPKAKLALFTRRGSMRNPEGESALRPLYYYVEAKRRALVNAEIAAERTGCGYLDIVLSESAGEQEITDAVSYGQSFETGDQSYSIRRSDAIEDVNFKFASNVPDISNKIQMLDHQTTRLLDDTLSELGISGSGSRAVASEMRINSQRSLTGLCNEICNNMRSQVFHDIYKLNGWNTDRMCSLSVGTLFSNEDIAKTRLVMEAMRDGTIDKTPELQQRVLKVLGLED
tara:strand:- start:4756 stop:6051 length:1296 start_codon:yes stop_codon:yes gene_type:complete